MNTVALPLSSLTGEPWPAYWDRAIQTRLGHRSVKTTMIYLRCLIHNTQSPLDRLRQVPDPRRFRRLPRSAFRVPTSTLPSAS